MDDLEFTFDVKTLTFTHEPTGYTMTHQFLLCNDDPTVIHDVYTHTGFTIDNHLVTILRWTAEEFLNGGVQS